MTDVLREPDYDNEATHILREVHQFHPSVGCHNAVGNILTKGAKVKKVGFQLILKNIKNSQPIPMDVIRRRTHKNRITTAVWYLDPTYELVKYKFIFSSAADGRSRCVMCLKYSKNNRGHTAYDFLKEAIRNHATQLQVHGDKGTEKRFYSKTNGDAASCAMSRIHH